MEIPLPLRVLVTDDEPDIAELVCELFARASCECRIATTGQQAIDVAVEFNPDILLLDLGLPDISGYHVARSLRARPEMAALLIVAVSGSVSEADQQRAFAAGIDQFLAKPARGAALLEVIQLAGARRVISQRSS